MYREPYIKVVHLWITTYTKTCLHPRLAGCLSETQISDSKLKIVYFYWLVHVTRRLQKRQCISSARIICWRLETSSYITYKWDAWCYLEYSLYNVYRVRTYLLGVTLAYSWIVCWPWWKMSENKVEIYGNNKLRNIK